VWKSGPPPTVVEEEEEDEKGRGDAVVWGGGE